MVGSGAAVVSGVAAAGLPSVLGLAVGVAGGAMLYVPWRNSTQTSTPRGGGRRIPPPAS